VIKQSQRTSSGRKESTADLPQIERAATALREKVLDEFRARRDSSSLNFYQSMAFFAARFRVMWLCKTSISYGSKPEFDEDDLYATSALREELGQHLKLFCQELPALIKWFVENLRQMRRDIVWVEREAEKFWPMNEMEYHVWTQIACYGKPAKQDWQAPGWLDNWPEDLPPKVLLSAARSGRLDDDRTARVLKQIGNRIRERLVAEQRSALNNLRVQSAHEKEAVRQARTATLRQEEPSTQRDSSQDIRLDPAKGRHNKHTKVVFEYSPDYSTVTLRGQAFSLTKRQARVVDLLHKAYEAKTPELLHGYILEKLSTPQSRLRDSFRKPGLWNSLFISSRGKIRLNIT
jgi:hypothetical protein